jgi:hypothetical protein
VRQEPVQPGADQHDDVGILEHGRARRARRLRVRVGQQALRHAHGRERDAGRLDELLDGLVGLRVSGALAEDDQRTLRAFQYLDSPLHRGGGRDLRRRRVDHLHERLAAGFGLHHLPEQFGRQVEVDAARTAGHGRADRPRDADADVLRMQHPEGRLAHGLRNSELVHLL